MVSGSVVYKMELKVLADLTKNNDELTQYMAKVVNEALQKEYPDTKLEWKIPPKSIVDVKDLKSAAIAWVKALKESREIMINSVYPEQQRKLEEIGIGDICDYESVDGVIFWIKYFFGITETDIAALNEGKNEVLNKRHEP